MAVRSAKEELMSVLRVAVLLIVVIEVVILVAADVVVAVAVLSVSRFSHRTQMAVGSSKELCSV